MLLHMKSDTIEARPLFWQAIPNNSVPRMINTISFVNPEKASCSEVLFVTTSATPPANAIYDGAYLSIRNRIMQTKKLFLLS